MADNNSRTEYIHKGKPVPRVSIIIKQLAKEGLTEWANYLGFKKQKVKDVLDSEAKIGTMVHEMIEVFDGDDVENIKFSKYGIESNLEKEKVARCYRSYYLYKQRYPEKVYYLFKEHTLTCKRFGGTIDAVVYDWDTLGVTLVDYKTSKTFYSTMFLQLAAYVLLYQEHYPNAKIDGVRVILLDKSKGEMAKDRFISLEELEPYMEIFNTLVDLYYLMEKIK